MLLAIAWLAPLAAAPLERRDLLCGAHCCYVALSALNFRVGSFADFEKRLGKPSNFGYSIQQLKDAAIAFGAQAESVRCDFAGLARLDRPFVAIPLLRGGHFVALVAFDDRLAWIVDPPDYLEVPRSLLEGRWPGEALVISTKPLPAADIPARSPPTAWWIVGAACMAGAIGVLALVIVLRSSKTLTTLIAALLCGCSQSESKAIGPAASVDATSKFLGRYFAGQADPPTASFFIRNVGTGELKLTGISVSCSCAEAGLDAPLLRPTQVGELRVKLKPHQKACSPSAQIKVRTNDPKEPILNFHVHWEVVQEFELDPVELEFDFAASPSQAKVVRIHYNGAASLQNLGPPTIEYDRRFVAVNYRATTTGDLKHAGDLLVSALPAFHSTDVPQNIYLRFPHDKGNLVVVARPIQRRIVEASPSEIYCGVVSARQKQRVKVLIRASIRPIAQLRLVAGAAAAGMPVKVFDPKHPTDSQIVDVELEAPQLPGVFCKPLQFEVNGDSSQRVQINVRGLVQ